jgi:hypothetical protein
MYDVNENFFRSYDFTLLWCWRWFTRNMSLLTSIFMQIFTILPFSVHFSATFKISTRSEPLLTAIACNFNCEKKLLYKLTGINNQFFFYSENNNKTFQLNYESIHPRQSVRLKFQKITVFFDCVLQWIHWNRGVVTLNFRKLISILLIQNAWSGKATEL